MQFGCEKILLSRENQERDIVFLSLPLTTTTTDRRGVRDKGNACTASCCCRRCCCPTPRSDCPLLQPERRPLTAFNGRKRRTGCERRRRGCAIPSLICRLFKRRSFVYSLIFSRTCMCLIKTHLCSFCPDSLSRGPSSSSSSGPRIDAVSVSLTLSSCSSSSSRLSPPLLSSS